MFKRVTLLALTSMLILAGCGGGESKKEQEAKAAAAAAEAPKPAEAPIEMYEMTKDDITSHKDWTSRNISILGTKIGERTRDVEKNFGALENTRTTPEEYLTIYQGNGLFVYTYKITGRIRKFEVYDVYAKQIKDENFKKLLTTGDLKLMRDFLGPEEGIVENEEEKSTEYAYDAKGFRFVKFKVGNRTLNALRFSELPKKTTT